MPYLAHLIRLLQIAPHRLSPDGALSLSASEAALLRACDFSTAQAGTWTIPPLPPNVVRLYGLPAHLSNGWEAPHQEPPAPSSASPAPEPLAPRRYATQAGPPPASLSVRLTAWLKLPASADPRRLLASLVRHPGITKRRLQQHLRRVPAARFNRALDALLQSRLAERHGARELNLSGTVREAIQALGIGVSPRASARALAGGGDGSTGPRRPKLAWYEDRDGHLRCKAACIHGRRTLPPAGTSEWGRSMLAIRGGLARQAKCRALGICPTAAATARRLELRRRDPMRAR